MSQPLPLSNEQLLQVLMSAKDATAIHYSEKAIIQYANDAMIAFWGKGRGVIGKTLEDALPELKGQPFIELFARVWREGITISGTDTPAGLEVDGKLQTFYFDYEYRAVKNEAGETYCILHTASDVTIRYLSQLAAREGEVRERKLIEELEASNEELAAMNEELTAVNEELRVSSEEIMESRDHLQNLNKRYAESEARFRAVVEQAPVAIGVLKGRQLTIDLANEGIVRIWGKAKDAIIDKPLSVALPELKGQPFLQILDDVYTSGNAYYGTEALASIAHNGVLQDNYFNFVYHPIKDGSGNTISIMVVANEVTEQVLFRQKIQQAEERLRLAVEGTDAGTWDLNLDTDEIIHSPRIAEIFGCRPDTKLTHTELMARLHPEDRSKIRDRAFERALNGDVYFYEARVIWPDGSSRWIRSHGKITIDDRGNNRMLGTITDITKQRQTLEELKASEEQLRLATLAAELGTFDMDLVNGTLDWDDRCRMLFGISHHQPVSYEKDFLMGLHEDDRERISKIINNAFIREIGNGDYDVEYRTVGVEDKKLRWVRAKGKVLFNDKDEPVRFIGSVLDVTDKKQDELRKNDFIGMVSHELKTPLTSLKGYVQMLNAKSKRQEDTFTSSALTKVEIQINKMSAMINSFLNVSRLESSKIHLSKQDFELGELMNELIDENAMTNSNHSITFLPGSPIMVNADRDKVGYVINNFLSNAIKYSPKGKNIQVHCKIRDNTALISVKDEGMGIKAQDIGKLFERYYRVESEYTKHISGFGIGLYLSAEIIHLHHGNIWVESEFGQGATFYFTLPLTRDFSEN